MRFFQIFPILSIFISLSFPTQAISCTKIGPQDETYIRRVVSIDFQ